MKIRTGFVSNSSSSSFIVTNYKNNKYETIKLTDLNVPDLDGCHVFGWGPKRLSAFEDKLNFAFLQMLYDFKTPEPHKQWEGMLSEVLKENIQGLQHIHYNYKVLDSECRSWSYIDHQSVNDENTKMFKSKEALKNFLFDSKSFIQLDNDNH